MPSVHVHSLKTCALAERLNMNSVRLGKFLSAFFFAAAGIIGLSQSGNAWAATTEPTNCRESGPGSLRNSIYLALSGDTIDLRSLAPSCTRIQLRREIVVAQ